MMEECIEETGAVGDKEPATQTNNASENEVVTNGETLTKKKDITSENDNVKENEDEQTTANESSSDQVESKDEENKMTAIILGESEEITNVDENINNNNNNEASGGLSASDLERQNVELLDRKNINCTYLPSLF